jgi:DMSO/TMAO reductase YedYZ molybdopterin-dependent catalytic subunit
MKQPQDLQPSAAVPQLSRRALLKAGVGSLALAAGGWPLSGLAFPPEQPGEEPVPFLGVPRTGANQLDWETLDQWLTPKDQAFNVQHYGVPEVDLKNFKLEIVGRVGKPATFTLEQLKALPKRDQLMTLECSGNGSSKGFMNAVYNSRWTGAPLAPLLKKCRLDPKATEVVFFGLDRKTEVLRPGTDRELKVEVPFGRSLSLEDALDLPLLLAYERNGEPLQKRNGAPLRLIVPGWYGVACVKWLTRIEVRDRRYMGRFMGRDYVTVRGERRGSEIVYVETSVARMNLKSVVARVTRRPAQQGLIPLRAFGAAWGDGTEIKKVEVQMDGGEWRMATLDASPRSRYCWIFYSIDLGAVKPGKHTIVSRATDANGRVQPSADQDEIALKKTYWEAYQQWPREIEVGV